MKIKLNETYDLVTDLFEGITDKAGAPYLRHLEDVLGRVKLMGLSKEVEHAALLHDAFEDTWFDVPEMENLNYPRKVIELVEGMTRNENESYREYIDLILVSDNLELLQLKLADVESNLAKSIWKKEFASLAKRYLKTRRELQDAISAIQNA